MNLFSSLFGFMHGIGSSEVDLVGQAAGVRDTTCAGTKHQRDGC